MQLWNIKKNILLFTFSCEDDNNIGIDTVSITIEDLYAPQEGSQGQSISGLHGKDGKWLGICGVRPRCVWDGCGREDRCGGNRQCW